MEFSTKRQLSNDKFFQNAGMNLNLSGTTLISGNIRYSSERTLTGNTQLADVKFVTDMIASVSGGTSYTFGEGLTEDGSKNVGLGGSVTNPVTISYGGNELRIDPDDGFKVMIKEPIGSIFDDPYYFEGTVYNDNFSIYLQNFNYNNFSEGVHVFVFGMYNTPYNNDDPGDPEYDNQNIYCVFYGVNTSPTIQINQYSAGVTDYDRIIFMFVPKKFSEERVMGFSVMTGSEIYNSWDGEYYDEIYINSFNLKSSKPNIYEAIINASEEFVYFYDINTYTSQDVGNIIKSLGLNGENGVSITDKIIYDAPVDESSVTDRTVVDKGYITAMLRNIDVETNARIRANGIYGTKAALYLNGEYGSTYAKAILSAGVPGSDPNEGDGSVGGSAGIIEIVTPSSRILMGGSSQFDQPLIFDSPYIRFKDEYGNYGAGGASVIFDSYNRPIRLPIIMESDLITNNLVSGMIYYNVDENKFMGYRGGDNSGWIELGGNSSGSTTPSKPQIVLVNGNVTLSGSTGQIIALVSTSATTTVDLPASPSDGLIVKIKDRNGSGNTNHITVTGNGKEIDGNENDYIINTNFGGFEFVFSEELDGWFVVSTLT